ncbi:MAG TPA: aminoglycoside 6-adenylyltransferase [Puia sp.]|nr:aminoglycoside 6-adenylyltransferase [Puia sp.]
MRPSEEIKKLILEKAEKDSRIRAVLLNGSRANPKIKPDRFQDFDIVYIVTETESFLSDHDWIRVFGEILIMQLPAEMEFPTGQKKSSFAYLALFKDGNRIDLTLFPKNKLQSEFVVDSLTVLLLDKDNLFPRLQPASDSDYLIKQPSEKEFTDCCNEFWWVCTYVAKGLCRSEITYAKEMLEIPVRNMFNKMIEWLVGVENNFSVSIGKSGKYMKNYASPELYEKNLCTYPDYKPANIWRSLFLMAELFGEIASKVSVFLHVKYNKEEEDNVRKYLEQLHEAQRAIR